METELNEKDGQAAEKLRALSEDYDGKVAGLNEKIEQLRASFEVEKAKIEQTALDQMT